MDDTIRNLPDVEMLGELVGEAAARSMLAAAKGSLFDVLGACCSGPAVEPAARRVLAARELVRRALSEELRSRNVFDSPSTIRQYLCATMSWLPHEVFGVFFLDSQHRLLAYEELFRGTLSQTSVYPREVVKRALAHNCASVVLAHCHPSQCTDASHADELLTRALKSALAMVDVRVLDHFIVGGNQTLSFAARGLI